MQRAIPSREKSFQASRMFTSRKIEKQKHDKLARDVYSDDTVLQVSSGATLGRRSDWTCESAAKKEGDSMLNEEGSKKNRKSLSESKSMRQEV